MTKSVKRRRSSSDCRPSCLMCLEYGNCCREGKHLVNRRWTFSSSRTSETYCGDHTTLLYSSSGLTYVTNVDFKMAVSRITNIRRIRLLLWQAALIILAIRDEWLSEWHTSMPWSRHELRTGRDVCHHTLHLVIDICSCHWSAHSTNRSKAFCKIITSTLLDILAYIFKLSAKSLTVTLALRSISANSIITSSCHH